MIEAKKKYILLGPGRWGTRDRWLGIPVQWPQISNAKVIVEYALENFQIEASMGSHFFHNITSFNIGYFSIAYHSKKAFINWDWLKDQGAVKRSENFYHLSFDKTTEVKMDGKKGVAVIYKPGVFEDTDEGILATSS